MTAVEYLEHIYLTTGIDRTVHFNQAKELERQQLFEFWEGGINCTEEGGKSFDQYYKEKFNI